MTDTSNKATAPVLLSARDLNAGGGLFCPAPQAGMKIWNNHPRVFLDVARTGAARCPYCGTLYQLREGERFGAAH